MIKLGDRITVKPATFDVPGKDGKPKAIPGTVVYIHPAGRYCVLEFDVGRREPVTSVRLSSTVHDGELTDLINAARADLVLGGVLEAKANDETDPLIKKAVTTYVKAEFGLDNEDADRLRASYKEQRNGLSLSDSYIAAEGG